MLHGQSSAELEKRLTVAFGELVHDRPAGWISEGLVQVAHRSQYRQVRACLSSSYSLVARARTCSLVIVSAWEVLACARAFSTNSSSVSPVTSVPQSQWI